MSSSYSWSSGQSRSSLKSKHTRWICTQSVSGSGNLQINTTVGVGTGRLLKSDGFGQKGKLDCMEEILGRKSRSKRMEEVQVPVQSSVVGLGPGCIRKLAIESERGEWGSTTRSDKLCGTREPNKAFWRS